MHRPARHVPCMYTPSAVYLDAIIGRCGSLLVQFRRLAPVFRCSRSCSRLQISEYPWLRRRSDMAVRRTDDEVRLTASTLYTAITAGIVEGEADGRKGIDESRPQYFPAGRCYRMRRGSQFKLERARSPASPPLYRLASARSPGELSATATRRRGAETTARLAADARRRGRPYQVALRAGKQVFE